MVSFRWKTDDRLAGAPDDVVVGFLSFHKYVIVDYFLYFSFIRCFASEGFSIFHSFHLIIENLAFQIDSKTHFVCSINVLVLGGYYKSFEWKIHVVRQKPKGLKHKSHFLCYSFMIWVIKVTLGVSPDFHWWLDARCMLHFADNICQFCFSEMQNISCENRNNCWKKHMSTANIMKFPWTLHKHPVIIE